MVQAVQGLKLGETIHYRVRHHTRFRYGAPIVESFMEVRMEPLSDGGQRCHAFSLSTTPGAQVQRYHDFLGNIVNHFSIPAQHTQLTIKADAVVEMQPPDPLPSSLTSHAWIDVDAMRESGRYWDYLGDSRYAQRTPALDQFAAEIGFDRRLDPLTLLRWLNSVIYETFGYVPNSTRVDSPIDEALETRQGVCQDFSHIMIALVRGVGIPCRYVSGYLYHRPEENRSMDDTSHAWVEAMLPGLGWVGFDPTNNLTAAERHIRVAIGRDYADVPPTRGVFRGDVETELDVGVQVTRLDEQTAENPALLASVVWDPPPDEAYDPYSQQQQQ
ncbi:MAG: transglutaminase domain-containing protein [Candidatus Promineifilaceae bacterium]